jgi:hypothetical protein
MSTGPHFAFLGGYGVQAFRFIEQTWVPLGLCSAKQQK